MTYKCFDVQIEQKIAHIVLKRGDELNTMVGEFWSELPRIVQEIDDRAAARAIVISSIGKHFSAGMDLSIFTSAQSLGTAAAAGTEETGRVRANLRLAVLRLQQSFNVLERTRMPVLVAIQGGCVGGAVDMVSACDCRYATEDAFFVIQEINLGLTADLGTFPRLCHLLPQGHVRELAYSGRRLPAIRARELGLVNEIFPTQDAMLGHIFSVARDMAEKSPLAVYGSKVMINYARDHTIADGLDYIASWQAGMYHPETDMREAITASREKRAPEFADLLPASKGLGV
jgi:enoyl-CoA hydratase